MVKLIKRDTVQNRDVVVILQENGSADIATIYDQNDERVFAESSIQGYDIPLADLKGYIGSTGKIYTIGASTDYITECKRLAKLEKSMVLEKITNFNTVIEDDRKSISIREIVLAFLFFITLLGLIFS